MKQRLTAAFKAFSVHLVLSALVALVAAFLVFQVWFPHPYKELAGGQHLFWIMVGVDVVCGPLLTALLFNPTKSRRELTLDLSLVALMQCVALAYGLHSISQARPVVLAFETDRLIAVSAVQIDEGNLNQAPPAFQTLSWTGPVLLGTRLPRDAKETIASIELSLKGLGPSARPGWWQSYDNSRPAVQLRMKPLAALRANQPPEMQTVIDTMAQKTGLPFDQIYYLPLASQKSLDQWIALLDPQANIIGHVPVGGF